MLDPNESGLWGVNVQLSRVTQAGKVPVTTTTTPSSTAGVYSFTGLAAGDYSVDTTTLPNNYMATGTHPVHVPLQAGATATGVNLFAAPINPGSIAVLVCVLQSHTCPGIQSVMVQVFQGAVQVAQKLTDATGQASFGPLAPGQYNVQYTPPHGFANNGPTSQTVTVPPGDNATAHFSVHPFSPITSGDIITSLQNGQVNEYTPTGTFVQTLIPQANVPTGSAFDGSGNLYVTEFGGNDILEVDGATGVVSVFSDNARLADGTAFNSPESIAFGPGYSKMYVSDANRGGPGGGIHVIDAATGKGAGFLRLPSSTGSHGTGESDSASPASS